MKIEEIQISESTTQEQISDVIVDLQFKHDERLLGLEVDRLVDIFEAVSISVKSSPTKLKEIEEPKRAEQLVKIESLPSDSGKISDKPSDDQPQQILEQQQIGRMDDSGMADSMPSESGTVSEQSIIDQQQLERKDGVEKSQQDLQDVSIELSFRRLESIIGLEVDLQTDIFESIILSLKSTSRKADRGKAEPLPSDSKNEQIDQSQPVEGQPQQLLDQQQIESSKEDIKQLDSSTDDSFKIQEQLPLSEIRSAVQVDLSFSNDAPSSFSLEAELLADIFESVSMNIKSAPRIKSEPTIQEKQEIVPEPSIDQPSGKTESKLGQKIDGKQDSSIDASRDQEIASKTDVNSVEVSISSEFKRTDDSSGLEIDLITDHFEVISLNIKAPKQRRRKLSEGPSGDLQTDVGEMSQEELMQLLKDEDEKVDVMEKVAKLEQVIFRRRHPALVKIRIGVCSGFRI